MTAAQNVQWLTPEQDHVWRTWLDLSARILNMAARELQRDAQISLADYEVLVQLSEAPEHKQRIVALADRIGWERSRLSHQITRMAKRGLVRRESCAKDGRGAFVVLEDAGFTAIKDAAPGHVECVRTMMFDQLPDKHLHELADAFEIIEAQVSAREEAFNQQR